jgi:zinc transport system substrate-binding protein
MVMKSKAIVIILGVLVVLTLIALVKLSPTRATSAGKVTVTATFYPMAEFARQIGGDRVTVDTLVRPGVEPHDYEPTPGDLTRLYRSKVFVYNGAGLETWVPRLRDELSANHVIAANASAGIQLDQLAPGSGESGVDPHIWLDPVRAAAEVSNIEAGLVRADPAGAAYYHGRAAAYRQQLAALDAAYRTGLSQCARHDIVTSHQAFGYLGDRYGLTITAISGLSPDEEPSPQKLAGIAAYARAHHVRYIFFETLVSPKLAQTLATEAGAQTLVFNPLEGLSADQVARGDNYLSVQQANLNQLRIALDCK